MAGKSEQSVANTESTRGGAMVTGYKPVATANYDLRGNATGRQLGHWVRMKTRVMGNYDTGPGLICLVKLSMLHHFGRPLFRIRIWLRSQYALKARLRALLNKKPGR